MPERFGWRPNRRSVLGEVLLLVGATAWAVFLTWPLAPNLSTRVPQDLGDPLENAWILSWGAHAIWEQPLALFHANMFFPKQFTLAFAENMLGISIPLAPIFWVTGDAILLTNVAALAVTVAAGVGVALLVGRLTSSRPAAVAAAAAFMATPYRVASLSHIHVIAIHLLPFLLLTLIGVARRPAWWKAVVVGGLVGAQFWSSLTGGVVTLVAIGCWGLWTLATHRPQALRAAAVSGLGLVLGLLLAAPVLSAYRHARDQNPEYAHPEVEVLENSTTPGSFAYPPPGGPTVRTIYRSLAEDFGGGASGEETLFPGFVLTAAGLAGLVAALAAPRWRREVLLAVVLAAAGAILSFGPRWGGREDGLPLPFAVVSNLVPGGLTRVPARFGSLVPLALALLLGLGIARLRRPHAAAVAAVVVAALALEAWPQGQPFVRTPAISAAYEALADREGAVLSLPTLEYTDDGALIVPSVYREAHHLYFSTGDFRPRTNGYGAFVPTHYAAMAQQLQEFPTAESLQLLGRSGIDTVIVERELAAASRWAGAAERLRRWPGVTILAEEGSAVVFDITDAETQTP